MRAGHIELIIMLVRAGCVAVAVSLFGWSMLPLLIVMFAFEKVIGPTEAMLDRRRRAAALDSGHGRRREH